MKWLAWVITGFYRYRVDRAKSLYNMVNFLRCTQNRSRVMGVYCEFFQSMMTSSNGNIFRVTGHLWGESTGHRWIPLTIASDAELWCFLWSAPEQTVKKWRRRWCETPSRSLWHHYSGYVFSAAVVAMLAGYRVIPDHALTRLCFVYYWPTSASE